MLRNNFTLVEFFVALAVLALLTSLLAPSLKKVRDQSIAIRCVNNLKSLGVTSFLYKEDHNHIIVPMSQGGSVFKNTWVHRLKDYLGQFKGGKENSPFQCPDVETEHVLSHYSIPMWNGCSARGPGYSQVPEVNVSMPQHAILLIDNKVFFHKWGYFNLVDGERQEPAIRHLGGQNRLYLDGRVEHAIWNLDLPQGNYWFNWSRGVGQ